MFYFLYFSVDTWNSNEGAAPLKRRGNVAVQRLRQDQN